MKKNHLNFLLLSLFLSVSSCNIKLFVKPSEANHYPSTTTKVEKTYETESSTGLNHVFVANCKSYIGTPYKFGGQDSRGMDCSGLLYVSFQSMGISIPRVSYEQANFYKAVSVKNLEIGDLLFFNTIGSKVSHTGVVSKITNEGKVSFVHAGTTFGVIEETFENNYWKSKFVKATRPTPFIEAKSKFYQKNKLVLR